MYLSGGGVGTIVPLIRSYWQKVKKILNSIHVCKDHTSIMITLHDLMNTVQGNTQTNKRLQLVQNSAAVLIVKREYMTPVPAAPYQPHL